MQYHTLRSTSIDRVGYDSDTQELEVRFVNGQSYTLTGVPPDIANGLITADSPGRYFNQHLKGQY